MNIKLIAMRKLILFLIPVLMVACNKIGTNASLGWYTDLTQVAKTSGFDRVNQAIANNERIYTTGITDRYDRYATRDFFFNSKGYWSTYDSCYGTCRFLPEVGQVIHVLHIKDSNTLVYYYNCNLYDPAYVPSSAQTLGKVYAGKYIGDLIYYSTYTLTYTYTKIDNKIYVSNGDIYTITSSGLIKDGTSAILSKYDPSKSF